MNPTPTSTPAPTLRANGKIAFSRAESIHEIHSINAAGSNEINLPGFDVTPVWSPDGSRIAFTRNSDIYVMNADGSNPTRLTNDPADDLEPGWSPDGTRIVFARMRIADPFTEPNYGIYVMNADGSNQTMLKDNWVSDPQPAWSPDGTKIAFTFSYAIFVMNPDGSNQTRLTDIRNWQPCWSPDGTRIVFSSERHGFPNYEIYVMNADGSNQTRITNNAQRDIEPAWSPDGSRIAFARYQDNNDWNTEEIYVMNPDGSNQTRLTNNRAQDYAPAWSRDGARIVFTTNQVFNPQIYVINLDGSGKVNLSNNSADDYDPVWSPAGDRLAFVSNRDGNYEIYLMNPDGSNQTRLTNNPGEDSAPAWSPDGTKILFVRNYAICVMNADGSSQTVIGSPSYYIEPAWSPDGSKIAFTGVGNEIYVMNADGSNTKQLTHNPNGFGSTNPAWSPDGAKIAFERGRDIGDEVFPDEIFVMNADGSNQVNLTNNPTEVEASPAWTPDGRVTFTRGGLYVMNADGSNQTRLSDYTGDVYWQPTPTANQIDDASFFVRQQYLDFLNREADANGLAFWTNEITLCGGDQQCIELKRINVSAAYFLSIEFQQTGYLVYRFYKASYGNALGAPVPLRLNEFLPDTKEIGQGVIVNQNGWEQVLESNKQAFATEFVQRPRFVSTYPTSMSAEQFVDALFANAGVTPSATDRTAAINEFGSAMTSGDVAARARALRRIAENSALAQQEFNRAFVLMQYFGYLRRNPNDLPEPTLDFQGYNFWVNKLTQFNGDFSGAEMVKAFITSGEYRQRFGP